MSRRRNEHAAPRRRGLTLIEMVVALAAASVLMAAMASTMFVALRASDPTYTVAPAVVESLAALADMAAELQFATAVTVANTNAVTVTVPDRNDADALPETIHYHFTGSPARTLKRQYNGGAEAEVLKNVYALSFLYYPNASAPKTIVVTLQGSSDAASTVHTGIPLINMP